MQLTLERPKQQDLLQWKYIRFNGGIVFVTVKAILNRLLTEVASKPRGHPTRVEWNLTRKGVIILKMYEKNGCNWHYIGRGVILNQNKTVDGILR